MQYKVIWDPQISVLHHIMVLKSLNRICSCEMWQWYIRMCEWQRCPLATCWHWQRGTNAIPQHSLTASETSILQGVIIFASMASLKSSVNLITHIESSLLSSSTFLQPYRQRWFPADMELLTSWTCNACWLDKSQQVSQNYVDVPGRPSTHLALSRSKSV